MHKVVVSAAYDGCLRQLLVVSCSVCRKRVLRPRHVLRRRKTTCCSRACAAVMRQRRVRRTCQWCGQRFERKRSAAASLFAFCSRPCRNAGQCIDGVPGAQPSHYRDGERAYRLRALRYYDRRCMRCGYAKVVEMLDVHHRDGDRQNGQIKNLEVVCVWCHTLTTRKVTPHKWRGHL